MIGHVHVAEQCEGGVWKGVSAPRRKKTPEHTPGLLLHLDCSSTPNRSRKINDRKEVDRVYM